MVCKKHVCAAENKITKPISNFMWRTMLFKIKLQSIKHLLEDHVHSSALGQNFASYSSMKNAWYLRDNEIFIFSHRWLIITGEMIDRGRLSVPCPSFNNILYKQKIKKSKRINEKIYIYILLYY